MNKDFLKRYKPRIMSASRIRKNKVIKRLDRLSDAHRLGYNKAIEEFEKMINSTSKSYGDVVGFRILRQQLQELKSKNGEK